MKKKERAALEAELRGYIHEWRALLALDGWHFDIRTVDGFTVKGDDDAIINYAITNIQWEYMHAEITFHMENMAPLPPADREEVAVHELVHCYTAELELMDAGAAKLEERLVTQIARSLLRVRNAECPEPPTPANRQVTFQSD